MIYTIQVATSNKTPHIKTENRYQDIKYWPHQNICLTATPLAHSFNIPHYLHRIQTLHKMDYQISDSFSTVSPIVFKQKNLEFKKHSFSSLLHPLVLYQSQTLGIEKLILSYLGYHLLELTQFHHPRYTNFIDTNYYLKMHSLYPNIMRGLISISIRTLNRPP